jgi:hypothetical protein
MGRLPEVIVDNENQLHYCLWANQLVKSGIFMKYLCNNHRNEFANNPQQAARAWKGIIEQARELFHMREWEKATIVYGNAFEISELLLTSDRTQYSVDRYLRSALELVYALRKKDTEVNLAAFILHVEMSIKGIPHSMALPQLMRPLEEVSKMPINLVDFWMLSLLSLDSIESRILH